jgi:cytosine/adenosine deaminase-related metal-dependent hydrolase
MSKRQEIGELTAVVGATVIDGNGGAPIKDGVVVIDGPRIVAVGDRDTGIPAGANTISAVGKYVTPGFVGMAYLADGTWPALTIEFEGRYDEVAIEATQLCLRGGITTMFDMWGPRDPLIKARDAINAGHAIGSRIFLAGNWIGVGGPYSVDMRAMYRDAVGEPFAKRIDAQWALNVGAELASMSADEVRREVRAYAESGVDYLIYVVNAHRPGALDCLVFSPRVQRIIVEEAHRAGMAAAAWHATTEEGIHSALDAEPDLLAAFPQTGRPLEADTVRRITGSGTPILFFAPPDEDVEWRRKQGIPPAMKSWFGATSDDEAMLPFEMPGRTARALFAAGATVCGGAGTAAMSPDELASWGAFNPPDHFTLLGDGGIAREQRSMVEKGLSPMAALQATTRNLARALRVDKDLGTLDPGKFADLVVLDADPLADPANYTGIHLVLKEGKVVDRDALPTRRVLTARPGGGQ